MSIRIRILLVSAVAIAPMASLALYEQGEHRKRRAGEVIDDTLRSVRQVAMNHQRLIDGAENLVDLLARLEDVRSLDGSRCSDLFRRLCTDSPQYANIGLSRMDGSIAASAVSPPAGVNVSDRAWFQNALATDMPFVGGFQVGRITGKPGLNVARRVNAADDRASGVVFVAIDLVWVNQLGTGGQFPRESTVTIWGPDGQILVRHPDPERYVGRTFADTPVLKAALAGPAESSLEATGPDGVRRLYAFRRLDAPASAVVTVGVPVSIAFEAVRAETRKSLWMLAAVSVLAILGAWFGGGGGVARITEKAQYLAETDLLTGLASRHSFLEDLEREFRRARRFQSPLALLAADIDHFKSVNDLHGHAVGDAVLKSVAAQCRKGVRDLDLVGRVGGEEFMALLLAASPEDAAAVGERMRRNVEESAVVEGGREIRVTLSVGAASLAPSDPDVASLMRRADKALYRAKHEGRNRVVASGERG